MVREWLVLLPLVALLAAPAIGTHEEGYGIFPMPFLFGGSPTRPDVRVLLFPPPHGDVGNPLGPVGPGPGPYQDAAISGLRRWEEIIHKFADAYPQYDYLNDVTVNVEVYDGVQALDHGLYDVVVFYVPGGPVFRGLATNACAVTRCIGLSLYSSSDRAHQEIPDFPEAIEVESVTLHEFGHTFGLSHTLTRTVEQGFDLMNSPYPFVYGDGDPLGDAGDRSPRYCISTLDLYAVAHAYRWLPSGVYQETTGEVSLPGGVPYDTLC